MWPVTKTVMTRSERIYVGAIFAILVLFGWASLMLTVQERVETSGGDHAPRVLPPE